VIGWRQKEGEDIKSAEKKEYLNGSSFQFRDIENRSISI
jgi:hypothetical protein